MMMPPSDESDRDCLETANANPTLLFPTPKSDPDPEADPVASADEAYQAVKDALRDERQEWIDEHRAMCQRARVKSERRGANADLLSSLRALLPPSPLEDGFSARSLDPRIEKQLTRSLLAVLREVEAMAKAETEEE